MGFSFTTNDTTVKMMPGLAQKLLFAVFSFYILIRGDCEKNQNEVEARQWLEACDEAAEDVYYKTAIAYWNYATNLTVHNQKLTVEASVAQSAFRRAVAENASRFDWHNFQDNDTKRQFQKLSVIGIGCLSPQEVEQATKLRADMEKVYSTARVCHKHSDNKPCMALDPELTHVMATSRDWEELLWVWQSWREKTGKQFPKRYEQYAELHNKAARKEGFADKGDYWRSLYEMPDFEQEIERLWLQVKPLYQQLHFYVRRKLEARYRRHKFPQSGHIPAHILGNMWGQSWSNIMDVVIPFPDRSALDVTTALKQQGYNASTMFRLSDEFFISLGLVAMPQTFWRHSLIDKPTDGREVICHASAWDFHNKEDFRIKMCTVVTMEDLVTIHHEMGHIQYDLQYKHQPLVYRGGANPGFHEAVGDTIALSVSTPEHLHEINLLNDTQYDNESDINFLMAQALDKIAFLPFSFLMDQWRWGVFRGDTQRKDYNRDWWKLRCKYQGIAPPTPRHDDDFDPGAKYHIPANVPYVRYFVSYIVQFQLHKALCETAGNTGPLHRCDIYRSTSAGRKLSDMLKMGSSRPWPDAMEVVNGQREMDASAILEYFRPLSEWLEKQNGGRDVEWRKECPDGSFTSHSAASKENTASGLPAHQSLVLCLCGLVFQLLHKKQN